MILGVSAHNQEIIDKYLTGRIYPEIYAFRTGSIPEYIKVGDTYRGVNVRLEEWKRIYENLSEIFRHPALIDENTIFRDHSVHKYLEIELHKHRLRREENPKGLYWSNEFFHNTDASDIRSAISDIEQDFLRGGSKYNFYTLAHIPQELIPPRDDEELTPRDNQKEAIARFLKAVGKGHTKLLMYAVMRFGKTFTSLCCAKAIGARKILILTAKPNVMREWRNAVLVTKNFDNYNKFLTSKDLARDHNIIQSLVNADENVVVFLSLQDLSGKIQKKKHGQVRTTEWDIVIIDETHFGARAASYGEIVNTLENKFKEIKALSNETILDSKHESNIDDLKEVVDNLNSKVSIHLSGTPYRILMSDEFTPEQIISSVQYSDILEAKEQWQHDNCIPSMEKSESEEVDSFKNPYFGFPKMIRFAFHPNKSALLLIETLQREGFSSALSMLFKPKNIINKPGCPAQFKHEPQVLELLGAIDGQNPSENILPFLAIKRIQQGKLCRHIVMVLPYRASCDAMEQLLLQHTEFENLSQYQILNIAGFNCPSYLSSPENVASAIENSENSGHKTITLTVNRMLTGSTVPQWDTMFFLKDTQSPEEYDQATFRLQSPYIKELTSNINGESKVVKIDMKPQTILVDFSPERVFTLQEQRSLVINATKNITGNDALQPQIEREVRYSPIITFDHRQLTELSSPDIMRHIRKYHATRSILDEAAYMPVDYKTLEDSNIRSYISTLRPIDDKNGLCIHPKEKTDGNNPVTGTTGDNNPGSFSNPPHPPACNNTNASDDKKEKEEENKLIKKLKAYYARIFFFAFLTYSEVNNLNSLINAIKTNDDDFRIAGHLDLDTDMLKQIAGLSNYQIRSYLDFRIESINKLWREISGTPIEKVKFALQKFGRMSESEVVTPPHIADDMVAMLPDNLFEKDGIVLDIASKQGEFAAALVKRYWSKYPDECQTRIYSLCTSTIAYEFTRKVYQLLGLDVNNIISDKTSYTIIADKLANKKKGKFPTIKEIIGKDMKINTIVGNPPYHVNDGGGGSSAKPIYDKFADFASMINPPFVSMIMPSRWMTGGKGLNEFRSSMLKNHHIRIFHDYLNASDCFDNVSIEGGICYYFIDFSIEGPCQFISHTSNGISIVERYLDDTDSDVIVRDAGALSILDKVVKKTKHYFSEIVLARNPFSLSNRNSQLSTNKIPNGVKVFGRFGNKREIRYLPSDFIPSKGKDIMHSWKVFLSKADGAAGQLGNPIPARIIGNGVVGDTQTICTETFLTIAPFDLETEAKNAVTYCRTKFFRFMVGIRKLKNMTRDTYKFVPMQDFTAESDINWGKSVDEIDRQLYDKYNLSDEEIAFIDSMIQTI